MLVWLLVWYIIYKTFIICSCCITAFICIEGYIIGTWFYYRHQMRFWKARADDWYKCYEKFHKKFSDSLQFSEN